MVNCKTVKTDVKCLPIVKIYYLYNLTCIKNGNFTKKTGSS